MDRHLETRVVTLQNLSLNRPHACEHEAGIRVWRYAVTALGELVRVFVAHDPQVTRGPGGLY